MSYTTAMAHSILSINNGNLTSAINDTTQRFKRGSITESEMLRIYDVLIGLCAN